MTGHPAVIAFADLHRRLVRSRMLRDASIGLAAGLCATPLVNATASLAVAAAGAAAGAAYGAVRAPRPIDAARLLDRRLAMADRLVTCLEVSDGADPMSRLVLDDAWERLRGVSHAGIAPMRTAAAIARVAAALVIAVLAGAPETLTGLLQSDTPHSVAGASEPGAAGAAEASASATGAASGSPGAHASPAGPREGDAADAVAGREPDASVQTPGGEGYLATTPGEGGGARAGRSDREAAGAIREDAVAPAAGPAGSTTAGGEGMSTATPSANTPDDRPDVRLRAGAGDAAAARVEAALDRANVPPGLRRYVMNYFLALAQ